MLTVENFMFPVSAGELFTAYLVLILYLENVHWSVASKNLSQPLLGKITTLLEM